MGKRELFLTGNPSFFKMNSLILQNPYLSLSISFDVFDFFFRSFEK